MKLTRKEVIVLWLEGSARSEGLLCGWFTSEEYDQIRKHLAAKGLVPEEDSLWCRTEAGDTLLEQLLPSDP